MKDVVAVFNDALDIGARVDPSLHLDALTPSCFVAAAKKHNLGNFAAVQSVHAVASPRSSFVQGTRQSITCSPVCCYVHLLCCVQCCS